MKKSLYHGTDNPKEILKEGFKKSEVSLYGKGVYFLEKKSEAKSYGEEVLRSEVLIKKPITFKGESGILFKRLRKKYEKKFRSFPTKDAIEEMNKKHGYDSAVFEDCSISSKCPRAWVIFDKKKIRKTSLVE